MEESVEEEQTDDCREVTTMGRACGRWFGDKVKVLTSSRVSDGEGQNRSQEACRGKPGGRFLDGSEGGNKAVREDDAEGRRSGGGRRPAMVTAEGDN